MSYLELQKLEKKYSEKGPMIVKGIDLSIEKGEFIVLLGPSGCGKTTIIRMISGLEEVTGGEILIDGESILEKKPRDRGVSMIFQSYAIWPHMTVFDNIAYPLKLQKVPKAEIKQRVQAAAEATNIASMLDRYPAQMSGGQRQRVAVSRCIVVKPKIFLMDEPLSNLDAKLRVSMRTELKNIHIQEHSTTIFVTHDQSEAMSLADRIVVMNQGEIEQIGTPLEVYRDSATRFVASFIGTPPTNFFPVTIRRREDRPRMVSDLLDIPVPEALREALAAYEGREVELGIRPEFIGISPALDRGPGYLTDAVIEFVEPQGANAILITRLMGQEVKMLTTEFMELPTGTKVSLRAKPEHMMCFDMETGKRIRSANA